MGCKVAVAAESVEVGVGNGLAPDILVRDICAALLGNGFHCPDIEISLVPVVRGHGKEIICKTAGICKELLHLFCCISLGHKEEVNLVGRVSVLHYGCNLKVICHLTAYEFVCRVYPY